MNETDNEDYIPADSEEAGEAGGIVSDGTEEEPDNLSVGDMSDTVVGTDANEELVTETLQGEADGVTLQTIHFDLLMLIFLILFFWLYERIKVGIRNFRKLSK